MRFEFFFSWCSCWAVFEEMKGEVFLLLCSYFLVIEMICIGVCIDIDQVMADGKACLCEFTSLKSIPYTIQVLFHVLCSSTIHYTILVSFSNSPIWISSYLS